MKALELIIKGNDHNAGRGNERNNNQGHGGGKDKKFKLII